MMEAKIDAVRWKWAMYLRLVRAIDKLVMEAGGHAVVNFEERELVEAEIGALDKLISDGYTHFKPIKKGG